jgi:hypothetical protein
VASCSTASLTRGTFFFTAALLLLYCCFTAALLLLYRYFTSAGGELFDRIIEKGHFSEHDAADCFHQIILAVLL